MMSEINPQHLSFGQVLGRIIAAYKRAPKMQAVDPNSDPETIERVRHVLRPKEKLLEFFARTGLGKAQVATMTRSQITRFVEQVERNKANEPSTAHFEPRGVPRTITITDAI